MPKGVKQSVFEPCWDQTVPAIETTNCTENLHLCAAVPGKTSVTSEHNNMIIQQTSEKIEDAQDQRHDHKRTENRST